MYAHYTFVHLSADSCPAEIYLKFYICPRSEALRAGMLLLRTSNFQVATIIPIVLRQKHSVVMSLLFTARVYEERALKRTYVLITAICCSSKNKGYART